MSSFFDIYVLIIKSTDFYSYFLDSDYKNLIQNNTLIETYNITILIIITIMLLLVVFKLVVIFTYFFVYGLIMSIIHSFTFIFKNGCSCVSKIDYIMSRNYLLKIIKKIYT